MLLRFKPPMAGSPDHKLADVELVFTSGMLAGLKLVGISLWTIKDGGLGITFPSRRYQQGGQVRFYSFLQSCGGQAENPVARLRSHIQEEFSRFQALGDQAYHQALAAWEQNGQVSGG